MPKGRSKELVINMILAYAWQSLICNTLLISLGSFKQGKEKSLANESQPHLLRLFLLPRFSMLNIILCPPVICVIEDSKQTRK